MKVSWGYCSQYMESHKSHVPNHQPEMIYYDRLVIVAIPPKGGATSKKRTFFVEGVVDTLKSRGRIGMMPHTPEVLPGIRKAKKNVDEMLTLEV